MWHSHFSCETYRCSSSSPPPWTLFPVWRAWSAGTSLKIFPAHGERRVWSTPSGADQTSEACTRHSPPSPPCTAHSVLLNAMVLPRECSGGRWCPGSHWCAPSPCSHPTGSFREKEGEEVSDKCPSFSHIICSLTCGKLTTVSHK